MRKSILLILPVVFALLASACNQEPVDVKSEIEAVNLKFMEAANSGDIEALNTIYLPDATVYPPGSDAVTGADQIIPMMVASAPAGIKMVFETVSAWAHGTTAIEDGKYKVLGPDDSMLDHGKYIVIWKKKGDEWLLSKDIWNSSMPPAMPAADEAVMEEPVE